MHQHLCKPKSVNLFKCSSKLVSAWYQYRCITSLTLTHTLLSVKTIPVENEKANVDNEI